MPNYTEEPFLLLLLRQEQYAYFEHTLISYYSNYIIIRPMEDNLITIAIRRQEQAEILCKLLEQHDIKAVINEINKDHTRVGDGVRVRIHEIDLVKELAVIEQ